MSYPPPPSGNDENRPDDDNPYAPPSESGTGDDRPQPKYGQYAPEQPPASPYGGAPNYGSGPAAGQQPVAPGYGQAQGYGQAPGYGQAQGYGTQQPYGAPQSGGAPYGQTPYGQPSQDTQGYPAYQGYPGQPQQWGPPPTRSGMAIAAMVCSLAGLLTCGLSGVVGLVLGIVSMVRINRSRTEGRPLLGFGMALTGIIVGALFTMWFLLFLLGGGPAAFMEGFTEGVDTSGDFNI